MKKPSSHEFSEATYKLLATPDIIPTAKFLSTLTKPSEKNIQEDDDTKLMMETHRNSFFRHCATTFPGCLSLKLMRVYAATRVPTEIRETSLKFLQHHLLLSQASLHFLVIQEISPILITCLEEQVISDSNFEILSDLVNRIASEIFVVHEATWHGLRDYISSNAETEFARSVYVFKKLSMLLDGEEFVVPVMKNLAPAILKRLGNDEEEESVWCLAFVGGFCAAIHLLETKRVDLVKDLFYKMLESIKRRMRLGFVLSEALKEVEMIVLKQLGWYCSKECRFVSGLVRRIGSVIEDDKSMEIVLHRIKMVVEKKI